MADDTGIGAAKSYHYPLIIRHLWHAPLRQAADQEIVYRDLSRFTYRECRERVVRLASTLAGMGVQSGDAVGVLNWDSNGIARELPAGCAVLLAAIWRDLRGFIRKGNACRLNRGERSKVNNWRLLMASARPNVRVGWANCLPPTRSVHERPDSPEDNHG